ncbi:hypothetical protein [Prosthecobacter dejongeii]|uniref:Uncharacterized protein n=1 Tax=Prosthecobacter dejongeii TaxID=48465 RepID=A0A7W7YH86_9BACT|nr:hypothetical protein [Prosthecobacter dejongeii]MBB5036158.1 hypothetical protein [Prosthecobacter dejongeii]
MHDIDQTQKSSHQSSPQLSQPEAHPDKQNHGAETALPVIAAPVDAQPVKYNIVLPGRTPRGTNPDGDAITTRHHVICVAGVLADLSNGGYDQARIGEAGPDKPCRPQKVHVAISQICPWVINAEYLNFTGSRTLAEKGLERTFKEWIANRTYFFSYKLPRSSEHPARRSRGIASIYIYKVFYDTFVEDIQARRLISEDRAKAFWQSVAVDVAFRWPGLANTSVSTQANGSSNAASTPAQAQ